MDKLRLFLVLSVLGLLAAGCGGGSSSNNETPTQPVTVSLSELSATVEISTTHQFSATVQNAADVSVDWQVNKLTGGNSTVGTISDSGLYTAPDHVPSPVTVTVTAVSHADTTKDASATVTVMSNVTISVSPLSSTVEIGKTQQFSATVQNAKDTAVDWQVNNVAGGNSTVGTISESGLYTAPAQVPSPSTVTITAVSRADPAKTVSAAVTVTANITISVSPLSATVEISKTYQFSATVQNTGDTSVDWQVDNVSGGNSTVGTITASGLYTAPDRIPADSTVTIKAIANADPTKEASASVTIMSNATVSITPTDAAIPAGQTKQFTATVQNAKDATVVWQVNEIASGNDKLGTITSAGLYTAPSLPPAGGAVTITAISAADTSKTAAVNATIQFSNASLSGPYIFTFSGNDQGGPFHSAGRFVADGNGNITDGVEDLNGADVTPSRTFTGTYEIRPEREGRASVTLYVSGPEGTGAANFRFELTNKGEGPILSFNDFMTGSGQIYKQDKTTFSNASMNGSYAFQFFGASDKGPMVGAGVIKCDGAGNFTGMEDVNQNELVTKAPMTGTYSVGANGRTILTTTMSIEDTPQTSQSVVYLISSDRAVLALSGFEGGGIGDVEKQQITTFSNASLSGDFVVYSMADPATAGNFTVGRFTSDGAGTITGVSDHNAGGVLASQNQPFTGTYSIPATDMGRGTTDVGAIFYLVSQKKAFSIGTDEDATAGQMVAQEGVPFTTSSLQGTFAFSMRGFDSAGGEISVLGSATIDGNGNYASNEAVNHAGTLTPNETQTGTYSVGVNGRGQLMITAGGNEFLYTLYVVDSSHVFLMETDTSGTATFGSMEAQF